MRSALTLFRTLPSFSVAVAVPAPVTTISPSCSGFAASTKSCVMAAPPPASETWTLWALNASRRAVTVTGCAVTRAPGTRMV